MPFLEDDHRAAGQIAEALAKRGLQHTLEPDSEDQPQSVLDLARRHSKKVYQVLRDHLGAELDAYDQADATLAGLKTAAAQPWFTELAGELAEKLGCKPRPWNRRAGVLHFSAKLGRLPKPDDLDEDDAEEIAELLRLEPLQQWVRQRNASLVYVESASDARKITRLLLAPTTDWIAMLRMCGTNGANYGLRTRDIVTWLAEKAEQHPFELQGCGHDFVAIRFTELIDESASPSPSLLNNAANVRLALDRTEEAIELYEAATHRGTSVVVLFNLSQAYGRIVQLDQQDLALAEAQLIDPVGVAALTDLHGSSPRTLVADLPVEVGMVRARLKDPAAARQAASALRRRFAPGRMGTSPAHSAVGVALAVLLGSGFALALRGVTGGREGGGLHAGVARLLKGTEAADPFLRMVRLAALRERQARIDKIKFALSVLVPGAAGVLSRQPILGLLGSMLFASALASWWAREGVVVDPLAVGAGASLLFGAVAVASAVAYAAVVAVTIAFRERS